MLARIAGAIVPPAVRQQTEHAALHDLYAEIPIRFPVLYEDLILGYRWEAGAELGSLELLANPMGHASLAGLLVSIRYDPHLAAALLPASLVPFARPAGGSYDPVCFRKSAGVRDCEVVQIDHESILCNHKIKVTAVLAPSFRRLVENVLSAR